MLEINNGNPKFKNVETFGDEMLTYFHYNALITLSVCIFLQNYLPV
jgi:hypothetical protein